MPDEGVEEVMEEVMVFWSPPPSPSERLEFRAEKSI